MAQYETHEHKWVDGYYGITCSICDLFVPDGCGWWMPIDEDNKPDVYLDGWDE